MMSLVLAQLAGVSLLHLLIAIIVIAGAVAITVVVVKAMGVSIPQWVIHILWILGVVVIGVLALKLLWSIF